jgi:hypothetical protein
MAETTADEGEEEYDEYDHHEHGWVPSTGYRSRSGWRASRSRRPGWPGQREPRPRVAMHLAVDRYEGRGTQYPCPPAVPSNKVPLQNHRWKASGTGRQNEVHANPSDGSKYRGTFTTWKEFLPVTASAGSRPMGKTWREGRGTDSAGRPPVRSVYRNPERGATHYGRPVYWEDATKPGVASPPRPENRA